jgi:hypothetical protein
MACGLSFTSTSSRLSRGGEDSKVKGPNVIMGVQDIMEEKEASSARWVTSDQL